MHNPTATHANSMVRKLTLPKKGVRSVWGDRTP
jgi:hypothetical protein